MPSRPLLQNPNVCTNALLLQSRRRFADYRVRAWVLSAPGRKAMEVLDQLRFMFLAAVFILLTLLFTNTLLPAARSERIFLKYISFVQRSISNKLILLLLLPHAVALTSRCASSFAIAISPPVRLCRLGILYALERLCSRTSLRTVREPKPA